MPDLFIQLTCLVELDLIELQTFHPRIHGVGPSETCADAADIHPVGARCGESEQLAAFETRRVYQYVVQMLPANAPMIGDDHIAGMETIFAVTFHSIANHDAQVRYEMRHAADVLRQQAAPG